MVLSWSVWWEFGLIMQLWITCVKRATCDGGFKRLEGDPVGRESSTGFFRNRCRRFSRNSRPEGISCQQSGRLCGTHLKGNRGIWMFVQTRNLDPLRARVRSTAATQPADWRCTQLCTDTIDAQLTFKRKLDSFKPQGATYPGMSALYGTYFSNLRLSFK